MFNTPPPHTHTLAVEIFSHLCLFHYVFSSFSSSLLMFFKPAHKNNCKGLYSRFQGFSKPTAPCTHYEPFPEVNVHRNHLAIWWKRRFWLAGTWGCVYLWQGPIQRPWGCRADTSGSLAPLCWTPLVPVKLFSCIPFIFIRHSSK